MIIHMKEIEEAKQKLAEQGDFNLMDGFDMMDERSLGWIAAPHILTFLFDGGIYAHKDDVYSFTQRYDCDNDSKLLFPDFCVALTPKDEYYAHQLANRGTRYMNNKSLPK